MSHVRPVSTWLGKRLKLRNARVPLTNHTHVRPDMRYYFRSGRFRPNPRTKHISDPPRHMTRSYVSDFNMISQHYNYKDTTSHTIGIQLPGYNTSAEDTCLCTDYSQMPNGKGKTHHAHVSTGVQALCREPPK